MKFLPPIVIASLFTLTLPVSWASNDHNHSGHGGDAMSQPMSSDMFLETRDIDGYTVSFHVMKAQPGMEHGGTHNFMLKVEKNGTPLHDVIANSKVIHPDGTSQSKMLMRMGDWYMAGYDLGHAGEHQLLTLFKTADGARHQGGVYFTGN